MAGNTLVLQTILITFSMYKYRQNPKRRILPKGALSQAQTPLWIE